MPRAELRSEKSVFCVEGTFLCAAAPRVPELGESSSIPQPTRAGPVFLPARSSKSSLAVLRDRALGRRGGNSGGGLGGSAALCVCWLQPGDNQQGKGQPPLPAQGRAPGLTRIWGFLQAAEFPGVSVFSRLIVKDVEIAT